MALPALGAFSGIALCWRLMSTSGTLRVLRTFWVGTRFAVRVAGVVPAVSLPVIPSPTHGTQRVWLRLAFPSTWSGMRGLILAFALVFVILALGLPFQFGDLRTQSVHLSGKG